MGHIRYHNMTITALTVTAEITTLPEGNFKAGPGFSRFSSVLPTKFQNTYLMVMQDQ